MGHCDPLHLAANAVHVAVLVRLGKRPCVESARAALLPCETNLLETTWGSCPGCACTAGCLAGLDRGIDSEPAELECKTQSSTKALPPARLQRLAGGLQALHSQSLKLGMRLVLGSVMS